MKYNRKKAFQIYEKAFELKAQDQQAFVKDACGGDTVLFQEVITRLKHAETGAPLEAFQHGKVSAGDKIGPYVLLSKIGEGGMGLVYLAQRKDDFNFQVAIKVVKAELSGPKSMQRFLRERQILANLKHPNIAQIFDGGETEKGLQYFVMEWVQGLPIHEFCKENRLGLAEILQLFEKVCLAVQYAHQNLVIHRDLKPANILVTEQGEPKLLDFGIATFLETSGDIRTETVQALTPMYASPEQIKNEHLTVASDIYALGAILFELLTGFPPHYQPRESSINFIKRVCNEAAPKASSVEGAIPAPIQIDYDLDLIIEKSLRIEPAQRYSTAQAFIQDLVAYQQGEPISARPLTYSYRLKTLGRKYPFPIMALLSITILIFTFSISLYRQNQKVLKERDIAQQERASAVQLTGFLTELFEISDPSNSKGESITAKTLLDQGAKKLQLDSEQDPLVRARFMAVVGEVYRKLGIQGEAQTMLQSSLDLFQMHKSNSMDLAKAHRELGLLFIDLGLYDKAELHLGKSLQLVQISPHSDQSLVAGNFADYGLALKMSGKYVASSKALQTSVAYFNSTQNAAGLAAAQNNLGLLYQEMGELQVAEQVLRECLGTYQSILESPDTKIATSLNNLGLVLKAQGKLSEAEKYWMEALEQRKKLYPLDHPKIMTSLNNLAALQKDQGKWDAAFQLFGEVVNLKRAKLGSKHPSLAISLNNLGLTFLDADLLEQATPHLLEAIEIMEEKVGKNHIYFAVVSRNVAQLKAKQGLCGEALEFAKSSVEIFERNQKKRGPHHAKALGILGYCQSQCGDVDEAGQTLQESLARFEELGLASDPFYSKVKTWLTDAAK